MDKVTLKQQIEDLGNWYQTIDFGNGVFTNNNVSATGTAEQVYQDIRSFLPRHLDSTHFLDVGCNSGYFIVRLMLDGAADATGVDIDTKCINQANFVKSFFLDKNKCKSIRIIQKDFQKYLTSIPSNTRYDAIIASSVLYPRTNIASLDRKYLEDYFYQRAKVLTDKAYMLICRWRTEDNCRNGDIFYEQLQKFNYQEIERKELGNRNLVVYQRDENLKLAKNHRMAFDDDKTRGWDEIISKITDCKNLRVWNRTDKTERKDLSDFITYVSPSTLIYRNFLSSRHQKIYGTTTELDFIANHKPKLFESVKEIGIQQPPVVRETDEGYMVDDGNHRSGLANALGFDKIAVIILKEQ